MSAPDSVDGAPPLFQGEVEAEAAALVVGDADLAAVQHDGVLHDGQTHANPVFWIHLRQSLILRDKMGKRQYANNASSRLTRGGCFSIIHFPEISPYTSSA